MTRALVLIDGEHYPPVLEAALEHLPERGFVAFAAIFLGGAEKTARPPALGIPVHEGDPVELLPRLIEQYRPDVVLDLSDEPVLDHRRRLMLAGVALREGVPYAGGGFRFDPPPRPRLSPLPSISVVGTGKRTGKTSVSIALARHFHGSGRSPVVVTMGRGGPPQPVVMAPLSPADGAAALLELAARGMHAASDYVEDALFAGVPTVGTRRVGAGPAGVTFEDNFPAGVAAAEGLGGDMLIFEGSGTAIPPAAADATVLVMGSDIDPEYLVGYFGPFRLGLADAVVVLGADRGVADIIAEVTPGLAVFGGRYLPEPTVPVTGRSVLVVTTAPTCSGPEMRDGLVALGASHVASVHSLGNRRILASELASRGSHHDLVLTEVKAAAVDLVLPWAEREGIATGLLHNVVEIEGGLQPLADAIEAALPQSINR